MNNLRFAQMLCSRLCHDMITPVGTLSTGFELLAESSEEDRAELMSLNQQSAKTALRRLVYYRAAFGYSAALHLDDFEAIEKLIHDYLAPININVSFNNYIKVIENVKPYCTLDLFARAMLNLALIAAEISPFGSELTITLDIQSYDLNLIYSVNGKLVEMRSETQSILHKNFDDKEQTPHTIQAFMTRLLLDEMGMFMADLQTSRSNLTIHLKKSLNAPAMAQWVV